MVIAYRDRSCRCLCAFSLPVIEITLEQSTNDHAEEQSAEEPPYAGPAIPAMIRVHSDWVRHSGNEGKTISRISLVHKVNSAYANLAFDGTRPAVQGCLELFANVASLHSSLPTAVMPIAPKVRQKRTSSRPTTYGFINVKSTPSVGGQTCQVERQVSSAKQNKCRQSRQTMATLVTAFIGIAHSVRRIRFSRTGCPFPPFQQCRLTVVGDRTSIQRHDHTGSASVGVAARQYRDASSWNDDEPRGDNERRQCSRFKADREPWITLVPWPVSDTFAIERTEAVDLY
jgi:hypothetical protein